MSSVDEKLKQVEREFEEIQQRLIQVRAEKAMSIVDGLNTFVEDLGELVDLHDLLDDRGKDKIKKFYGRVQERFAAMGLLTDGTPPRKARIARPISELQA